MVESSTDQMLSFLESFLDEKMQTLNKQLSANSELLAQLSKQVDELQAAKKPLKIDVLDTSHESSDAKRPSTTDNRKRQDFLKAEEAKHKKEEEDQKKEEAKHKKEEEERKKEEAKKRVAEEKAAKEAAKKQKEEELAKKKEAERLAKQQKEEEAKREKARKEEEMKAKKEEEKAAKKQKEEELAKKKEAERHPKPHKEDSKKEEAKKEEEGKKKPGEKRADPKGKLKSGKKEGAKEPAPHVEETKAPSEEPKTEEPPAAEPLALPESDSVDKGVKFSEDDNLLEEKPEETSEPPKDDPVAPIQAEIEKMEKSLGADALQQSKPFTLSIGSKSALVLLSNLDDAVFHLTSIPEPEVIWAFRLFFQLRSEPLPAADDEAWALCQAFLGKLLESKETLPSELQKVFAEQLIFSNENIDQVEQLVKGNEAKLDPAIYSDSSALVGILMFPLKDACIYCGLLPEKVESWRRYQRLLHKKKLLQGS